MLTLAAGLALQGAPATAEEWLARMEATLRDASSLRIEAGVTEEGGDITGIVWESKAPDRLRVECMDWPLHRRDDARLILIADGETVAWRRTGGRPSFESLIRAEAGGPRVSRIAQDEGLVARAQTLLARSGIGATVALLGGPEAHARTRNAAFCGERRISLRPATGVRLEVVPSGVGLLSGEHTVWIDQERFVPLRRMIRYPAPNPLPLCARAGPVWETYISVSLDPEIVDERFQIPPDW